MSKAVVWFRSDLRLEDNPALEWALTNFEKVIPVYIYEPKIRGGASNWWLHHSLESLDNSLKSVGSKLFIFKGDPKDILPGLNADGYSWSRSYIPSEVERDTEIKQALTRNGKKVKSHLSELLIEPLTFKNLSGSPYRVFTPFWKKLKSEYRAPKKIKAPTEIFSPKSIRGAAKLDLLPEIPWDEAFYDYWKPGESPAKKKLKLFLKQTVTDYIDARNIPSINGTSRLSPHLHFGEISPHEVWRQTAKAFPDGNKDADVFLSELAWREFAKHLLFHFPETTSQPLNKKFEMFPWANNQSHLEAWQKGETGIPIVDAGMRELWTTGWMHNRVRMIVGSFLVKNLLIDWRDGMNWFWDTLVDADLASNTLGWQWIGGCGADAAPYFRVFNPVLQGEKFDKEGLYVKKWVPELKNVPAKGIHNPLPSALVDLKKSRQRALDAYQKIK